MTVSPGTIFCHRCQRSTRWEPTRGGGAEKCGVCGTRFPCATVCGHLDCAREHAETRTRDNVRRSDGFSPNLALQISIGLEVLLGSP